MDIFYYLQNHKTRIFSEGILQAILTLSIIYC